MTNKINYSKILFFVLLPFSLFAQSSNTTLTLNQLIQLGLDSSKSLRISDARLKFAQAKYDQAYDAALPSVRLNANYTRLSDIEEPKFLFPGASTPVALFPVYVNNYSVNLTASEVIFSGFRLKYAKESTDLLNHASKFDFEKDKQEIIFTLISSYFTIYKLEISSQIITDQLKQINERVRETQLALNNGLATQNDLLRWQLQVSNLELTQLDIQNNFQIANFNLNLMLGLNENNKINVDTNEINKIQITNSLQSFLDLAAKNRSDLNSAQSRSLASFNNYKIAKNSYLPRISVQGELLDARPNGRYIPPVDQFNSTWAAGISFNWDLMNLYSNKHFVDEFQSIYSQSKDGVAILSDAIKSEVNQNYLSFLSALRKVEVMQKAVNQSEENLRLTDSRHKNSLITLSELLESNTTFIQAKINMALSKADVQIAYYKLLKSTGKIQ